MAPFDAAQYVSAVLSPLAKGRGLTEAIAFLRAASGPAYPTQINLMELYQVSLGSSDADIATRRREVTQIWTKRMMKAGPTASAARSCKDLDEALTKLFGSLDSGATWQKIEAARRGAMRQEVARLAETLRENFHDRKVITSSRLGHLVSSEAFSALERADIGAAISQAGLVVVDDLPLPDVSSFGNIASLIDSMNIAGARTILELVFDDRPVVPFTVIGGLRGPKDAIVSVPAINAAKLETQKRKGNDNDARGKALDNLKRLLDAGAPLADIAIHQLADRIAERVRGGNVAGAIKHLVDLGLDRVDAERIANAKAESAGGVARVTASSIEECLADADLATAQTRLAGLSPADPMYPELSTRITELNQRLSTLIKLVRDASAEGDFEKARRGLDEAARIDRGNGDVLAAMATLPLPPPLLRPLVLVQDPVGRGTTVEIAWTPPFGADEDTQFVVRRTIHRAAAGVLDGTPIAATKGQSVVDKQPLIAVDSFYTVFAVREGVCSNGASAETMVRPAPSGLRAQIHGAAAEVSWQLPPGATGAAVSVIDDRGTISTPRSGQQSVRLTDLRIGAGYRVSVVALYDGGLVKSTPETITIVARPEARPVPHLDLRPTKGGENLVTASWTTLADHMVTVRVSTSPPPWKFGDELESSVMSTFGSVLGGGARRSESGTRSSQVGEAPLGSCYFLALTDAGNGRVLIGQCVRLSTTAPPSNLTVIRRGTDAVVSWDWPDGVGDVDVEWSGDRSGSRTFNREVVRVSGGALIDVGWGPVNVIVRSVFKDGDERVTSAAVQTRSEGPPAVVRYTVSWPKFRRSEAVLTFVAERDAPCLAFRIVWSSASQLPSSATAGIALLDSTIELVAGAPATVAVDLKGIKAPFWLRCFAHPPYTLLDPPTAFLKRR